MARVSVRFIQRFQPMPEIIPPGGVIVAAGKFAIFNLVVLSLEQRVHLPVAFQQPIQPPGIHPDFHFGGGSIFHQVDDDKLIIRGNEPTRLAEDFVKDLR